MDSFGNRVPAFKLDGENQVKTVFGGVLSILILSLTLMYASIKFIDLKERANPVISTIKIPDHYAATDHFKLNDANFRMAFTVENVDGKKTRKDDPRFVKFIVLLFTEVEGVKSGTSVPFHECDESDFA